MDLIANADLLSKLLASLLAVLTAAFAFFKWVRPRLQRVVSDVRAGRDALVGRDAVHDSITGRVISPELPGIGVRMATTETQMTLLTDAVAKIADSHVLLEDHGRRIKALEAGSVERVAARVESTSAWRAVEAIAKKDDE